ncbi:MAG TPA: hypothetical protein DDW50_14830 [Firmicutes bacterium]|jgi:hypothetical protein|nr:hypothetical protein [Bacillota bacterium]
MSIKDYGSLAKLKIMSVNADDTVNDTFEAMFNPESYSETFAVSFKNVDRVSGGLEVYDYDKTPPQDFKLKLIIDGTGVTDYDSSAFSVFKQIFETVYEQINHFLRLAWYPVNEKAIPLKIEWGNLSIHCYLKEVTINYTLFDREGLPLRAELDTSFMSDPDNYKKDCERRLKPNLLTTGISTITALTTGKTKAITNSTKTSATTSNTKAITNSIKTSTTTSTKTTSNGIVISVS